MPQAAVLIVTFSTYAENEYTCSLFERMPGRTRPETVFSCDRKTKTFFFDDDEVDYSIYLRKSTDSIDALIGKVAPYVIVHVSCHDDETIWKEASDFVKSLKFETNVAKKILVRCLLLLLSQHIDSTLERETHTHTRTHLTLGCFYDCDTRCEAD